MASAVLLLRACRALVRGADAWSESEHAELLRCARDAGVTGVPVRLALVPGLQDALCAAVGNPLGRAAAVALETRLWRTCLCCDSATHADDSIWAYARALRLPLLEDAVRAWAAVATRDGRESAASFLPVDPAAAACVRTVQFVDGVVGAGARFGVTASPRAIQPPPRDCDRVLRTVGDILATAHERFFATADAAGVADLKSIVAELQAGPFRTYDPWQVHRCVLRRLPCVRSVTLNLHASDSPEP